MVILHGCISDAAIGELNRKYAGQLWVMVSDRETHMMNSKLTLQMWHECLTPACRLRRRTLADRYNDESWLTAVGAFASIRLLATRSQRMPP